MKKKFYWRSYVSISLLLSFLVIAVSGVILYLAPPGRVARWISWVMLGFNRGQWEDLHTLFSYLFIIFGLFHLFLFNWKLFFSYLRSRITRKINRKREIIFALATFLAIALFTLAKWPPVYSVMDLGNTISSGWAERRGAPPVPHAEEMTLNDLSKELFRSEPELVIGKLRELGFVVRDGNQTLDSLAVQNETSPSELFRQLSEYFTVTFQIRGRNY
jgi:hypothetical protein